MVLMCLHSFVVIYFVQCWDPKGLRMNNGGGRRTLLKMEDAASLYLCIHNLIIPIYPLKQGGWKRRFIFGSFQTTWPRFFISGIVLMHPKTSKPLHRIEMVIYCDGRKLPKLIQVLAIWLAATWVKMPTLNIYLPDGLGFVPRLKR